MKKAIALTLATAMSASLLAGCGGSQNGGSQTAEGAESSLPAYNELTVGTDYTDLKADLKFISHAPTWSMTAPLPVTWPSSRRCTPTSPSAMRASPTTPTT